jgi:NADH-quinone oxidoreductase subunit N
MQDLIISFPVLFATLWIVLLILLEAAFKNPSITFSAASIGFLVIVCSLFLPFEDGYAFSSMLRLSVFTEFANLVFAVSGLLVITLSQPYLEREKIFYGEYCIIVFVAVLGMMLMAAAANMSVLFIGLETMSIALYVLAGMLRKDQRSNEAAMKYFLLGAFSSSLFLYGIALIYGGTGELGFAKIAAHLQLNTPSPLVWIGFTLVMIGFLFKVSAVPFHQWTPDVYEGSPTASTALMSTGSKAAAFSAVITVILNFSSVLQQNSGWILGVSYIALATMLVGNIAALAQDNLKRMLAFSSIAHAGYMLVGIAAGSTNGYSAVMYYTLIYSLMNLGAFGVILLIEHQRQSVSASDYAGLFKEKPLLAGLMAVFMLGLTGIPPFGGFIGKYKLFAAAIESGLSWLAICGVLTSAVSAYYYLRVVVFMFMRDPNPEKPFTDITVSPALILTAIVITLLGVYPTGLLEFASNALKLAVLNP